MEGLEAIGLWYQKRWAEYLTFVATCAFLPYEVYELTRGASLFKWVALAANLVSFSPSERHGALPGRRPPTPISLGARRTRPDMPPRDAMTRT